MDEVIQFNPAPIGAEMVVRIMQLRTVQNAKNATF